MESHSQTASVKVYGISRWQPRVIGSVFLLIGIVGFAASGVILPLIVFGVMGAGMLVAGERTKVQISPGGVTSTPPLGRARSYPWSDIDGFVAQRIPGGYGGWTVLMNASDRWVALIATRRGGLGRGSRAAVEELAEQLNADLARARGRRQRRKG